MKVFPWSVGALTFSADRTLPPWSILDASTSSMFLFCRLGSRTRRFIPLAFGKGISGATGGGRGWSTAPSRTFPIPTCTSLPSSCINREFGSLRDGVAWYSHALRLPSLHGNPCRLAILTSHDSPVAFQFLAQLASLVLLLWLALHILLGNFFRINQTQRHRLGLPGPQRNVFLPVR